MNLAKKTVGIALAVSAATLLAGCYETTPEKTSATASSATEHSAHCYGVNKCGGHNDCKSAENACKGQGSCKGQGFVKMSSKACDDVGGKVGA